MKPAALQHLDAYGQLSLHPFTLKQSHPHCDGHLSAALEHMMRTMRRLGCGTVLAYWGGFTQAEMERTKKLEAKEYKRLGPMGAVKGG